MELEVTLASPRRSSNLQPVKAIDQLSDEETRTLIYAGAALGEILGQIKSSKNARAEGTHLSVEDQDQ